MSNSLLPREGKITDISLNLTTDDHAGENGIQVQEYDIDKVIMALSDM